MGAIFKIWTTPANLTWWGKDSFKPNIKSI